MRYICKVLLAMPILFLFFGVPASFAQTTITLVNQDSAGEGFNDNRPPFSGQTGNNGGTLGQQRLNVFQAAADYWEARILSTVTILVGINMDPLDCNSSNAVLGAAGPVSVFRDFPNAPVANTWYVGAVADSLAGERDPGRTDIGATFNSSIDNNNSCLSGINWWLGINSPAPGGTISLYDTVLHEIGHGLGFLSLVLQNGVRFDNRNDAYMLQLFDEQTNEFWRTMTNNERQTSSVNTGQLVWRGVNADSNSSHLSSGSLTNNHIRMFAPNPFQQGSSVSHWDTVLSPDELMEPSATPTSDDRSTIQLLSDVGWNIVQASDDFTVQNSTVTPTTVVAGNTIAVDTDQTYSGTSSTILSSDVGYYLSTDALFDNSDTLLGSDSSTLSAGDLFDPESATLTVPANTVPGSYFIIFVADHLDELSEVNEGNNTQSVQITVQGNDDFTVDNSTVTPTTVIAGNTIEVDTDQTYSGTSSTTLRPDVGYYLSTDALFDNSDTLLGSDSSTLRAGDLFDSESATLTIPANTVPGSYFIIFVADHLDELSEVNEGNNTQSVQIEVVSQTLDSDGDGLTDAEEIENNLNPNNPDSDGDNIQDNIDPSPRVSNNHCDADNAIIENLPISTTLVCAASISITIDTGVEVQLNGELILISPRIEITPDYRVDSGTMRIISSDPCPVCNN